jgi:nucleoside phosphorylase
VILVVAATEPELAGANGVATLACGIGPVESAATTARELAKLQPARVLHIGIAGARTLQAPALVIGSESVYEDAQTEPARRTAARVAVQARVLPDPQLVAALGRALPEALLLPIGTSARVGGTSRCEVEAMEGFAVLRAAELAGVPAVELRAVANAVGEPDRARWRFDDAFAALAEAIPRVLAELP